MQFLRTFVDFWDPFPDEQHCWASLRRDECRTGCLC
jgi:hypothetical protein